MNTQLREGIIYKNTVYSTANTVYIIGCIITLVAGPLILSIFRYLEKLDLIDAMTLWLVVFLASLMFGVGFTSALFRGIPQWIKRKGNILIFHYHIKAILRTYIKEIPIDIRTIERIVFFEPPRKSAWVASSVVIYTKGNNKVHINIDKEIYEMLKDLYFSMQGVDNLNKVVQR